MSLTSRSEGHSRAAHGPHATPLGALHARVDAGEPAEDARGVRRVPRVLCATSHCYKPRPQPDEDPYGGVIVIPLSNDKHDVRQKAAAAVRDGLDGAPGDVLGPAPLFRLRGKERAQVVVKAVDRPAAVAAVGQAVDAIAADRRHRGVSLSVDVDPQ